MPSLFMRSKLFVPGSRPELFAKALRSGADAISIDLEDAVPDSHKAAARAHVADFLRSDAARGAAASIVVRINGIHTPHVDADLRAAAQPSVALINIPKPESDSDIQHVAGLLARAELANGLTAGLPGRRPAIGLLANIETPAALHRAAEIGAAHPRVVALQLGLGDLFEPLGIARRNSANVHAAMFALRMAAAQAGVAACDGAFADIADQAGFSAEAAMAQRLGFIGKTCIHPSQVALANAVFAPSAAAVTAARRIVAAADQAAADGHGAFVVDGRMIDPPFLDAARALLASVAAGAAGALYAAPA